MFDKVKQHKNVCSSWLFSHSLCVLRFISHKSAYASTRKFIDKILLFLFIQYKDCFCLFAVSQLMSMSHYSMRFLPCIPSIGWIFLYHCTDYVGSTNYNDVVHLNIAPFFLRLFPLNTFFCAKRGFFTFFCQSYITSGIETHIRIRTILKCWPLIYRWNDEDDKAKLHF